MSSPTPDDNDDRTVIRARAPEPATVVRAPPHDPAAAAPVSGHESGLPAGTRLGEFELTSVLGEGGFGIVYLAWDHSLDRRVAVKEYMPSALAARTGGSAVQVKSARHRETFEAGRKSFVNEAKMLAQFDHPALVKVYRFWEANGTAYMAMPFYEGITLRDRLRELGTAPDEGWLMGLLAPLTEALAVIHAEHCYHRDIAPDNVILLGGSNRPLLLDFGAARRVIGDMTQALTVILKPGYAPLEQYAEAPGMKQGPWTDVYALAASVYFAITGKTPPPSVSRLLNDAYVPLAEAAAGQYSERFLAAIDKALRVKPADRTQTIDELRADLGLAQAVSHAEITRPAGLDPLAGAVVPSAAASGAAPGAAGAPRKRASVAALAGAGVVALAIAGAVAWWAWPGSRPAPSSTQQAARNDAPAPAPEAAPASASVAAAAPASPAPVATPPAPTAPARFDPLAEFDRVIAAQTPGFGVDVRPAQSRLRIGRDKLTFSVTSQRAGEVTVFALGPDGSVVRLFPNGVSPRVHIKAGQTLRLPPGDVGIEAAEPAGTEHMLVIVSHVPRNHDALGGAVEAGYLTLPGADALTARMASRPPSSVPLLLGDAAACPDGRCDEYGAARFVLEVTR